MGVFDSLSKKHIPTILGLAILGAGLVGGILLVNSSNTNSFLPRASPETTPKNLKITNVTDTSFTVSWVTDSRTAGYIRYGTGATNLTTTVTDDRDQVSGSVGLFKTHHVTIRSLKASTTYYFKVGTGTKELYDNNGSPYTQITAQSASARSRTIYGEVKNQAGTAGSGAIVYVTADDLAPMSALVQSSGSWVVSLAQARKKDLRGSATFTNDTVLSYLVVSNTDDATSVVSATFTQSQPVPDITIGSNQDFSTSGSTQATAIPQTEPAPEIVQSKFSTQLLAPATEAVESVKTFSITYPGDGEIISSTQPEIRGQGPASVSATLSITGPSAQTSTVVIAQNGQWTWTPTQKLKTGTYTLTAKATINGKVTTITRGFGIDPTVTTPAFTASTSAQTATPTPVPTLAPTTAPISTATDSSDVSYPSTASGEIVSGSFAETAFLLSGGAVLLFLGVFTLAKQMRSSA